MKPPLAFFGLDDVVAWLTRLVDRFVCFVQTGATLALNALIDGLGNLWGDAVAALPAMPGQPDVPSFVETAFKFARWLTPWDFLVTLVETDMTIIAAMVAAMALLRWLKVVE